MNAEGATTLEPLEKALSKRLTEAGHSVKRVHRVFPPRDTGGEAEILFIGRAKDVKSFRGPEPLTAYLVDDEDAEPIVATGW